MLSDTRVTGQLRIVVLKARHLQNRRKLEKQNPYVTLRIGHIVETTTVDYRGGQTPHWDDEAKFELTPELEPLLQLSILDETKKTPTLIAEKKIDITPAFSRPPKIGYDNWYTVEYAGREAGEIFLEMTFYPTAPKVPLKIPIKNRLSVMTSSSSRPLPSLPGQEFASSFGSPVSRPETKYADDILIKSFSSSLIHRKLPSPPPPETIPLNNEEDEEGTFHRSFPSSKTENNINNKLSQDLDKLFINSSSERGRRRSGDFSGLKKFASRFQQDTQSNPSTSANIFKKRPFSASPKKSFFSRFGNQQQQTQSNEDDFDLLEQQVQSDWEKNHPNEFQNAINRRFGKNNNNDSEEEEEEDDKTSSWTRSISSLNKNQLQLPTYVDDDSDSDEGPEDAPLPPPKSNNSSRSGNSLFSSHRSTESNDYAHVLDLHQEQFKRKLRKPPPSSSIQDLDIPYSADSIGSIPDRSIYLKSQKLPKLPNGKSEDEVLQSKYNAPSPDKRLAQKFRLEAGMIREGDLAIDPGRSGYKGSGRWDSDDEEDEDLFKTSFSPSRFKPRVPAKVPIGLTDEEYYVTDRSGYLRDLHGRRG